MADGTEQEDVASPDASAPQRNDAPDKPAPDPEGVLPETTDDEGMPLDNPSG
ncbi:hypothetical protein [Microbacterium sp. T2.11-28]|uniref:hypothetical protein n=1 Tax=unclassified Microbacterium TaxID=2609290 RepID=UPI002477C1BE|nr:hypothetical protein [Microbacterium sp. T2.11-28]CAI9387468.1 hypothetical protein MICABA_00906 [Microbacterium sp. T2.11-28]